MKNIFIGICIAVGIAFIILWYRWNECRKKNGIQPNCITTPCPFIFGNCNFWTGKPKETNPIIPKEGDACVTKWSQNGTWKNGICVQNIVVLPPPPPPPPASNQLEVTNPNGTFMYYQHPSSLGGVFYGKSNVLYQKGMKLVLIKAWYTDNFQNQGYYETNEKSYGANTGFVDIKDVTRK